MPELNLAFVRSFFPALDKEWIYMDNAGGTQTARPVAERISDYLLHTNVQLGATYEVSVTSGQRVFEAQKTWAEMIHARVPTEIAFGPSTTMLMQNLARSMVKTFSPGDEVIVTNCDHEANIGPWVRMQEKGITVKSWNVNPETLRLDLDDLDRLITKKTRLVAFTHVSNILGTINPVKEITRFVHDRGAQVCVDGVAYAPHRLVDVQELDVDFYVFSLYKVYGPHYALLYGKLEIFETLPGINHYFIEDTPYKLQPGNVNFELSYGFMGIADYFFALAEKMEIRDKTIQQKLTAVFGAIADHEEELSGKLLEHLSLKPGIRIIGEKSAYKNVRVPTISFVVEGKNSSQITLESDKEKIAIRYGDFYARRLIESLGIAEQEGVVRISLVHYNTLDEVDRLLGVLDRIL